MTATIREIMIPIGEYVSVGLEDSLYDYFNTLNEDRARKERGHSHRDALVYGEDGEILGLVAMKDVFMALEPGFKSLLESLSPGSVLTPEYLAKQFRNIDIWEEPLKNHCQKAAKIKVREMMHVPLELEFLEADKPLSETLNRYVAGVHQPLLVRDQGKIVGVVRYGDVFAKIMEMTLACEL